MQATAKLTVSVKRRLGNGDEVFIAPGIEVTCAESELDAKQAEVAERVKHWLDNIMAMYPDPTEGADDSTDEDADEDADDADEDGDGDGEDLTAEDVDAMDKPELLELIKENDLDVPNAKKLKVGELREAVKALLTSDDADEDGEDADEDDAGYTEAELKKMGLEELQKVCDSWDIGHPKIKKGADLKTKKAAYIAHILEAQEDE